MKGFIRRRGDAWELRVYLGTDPVTNKQRYASRTVRTGKREAQRVLNEMSGCFDLGKIALGTAAIALDPDASGRVLVAGIVPDAVSSISEGSTIIEPTQNLWFVVTDSLPHTFIVANSDGTKVAKVTTD